ncbi:cobalamin-binding protein [Wenzhouxiangella sp. XN79A]|uniref:ABC transporter substrate-binding protein n=1 Tax=Wenzhouxiangella sp. XN79A TaxID=2724193 RepID=UPI00144ABDDE|nr:cobalamin-binding protein [Wenzhouxiangella sp. XN79A]NKI34055.1 cobalamin-binding protein [Wenzhouxiangella sp. XN79A]
MRIVAHTCSNTEIVCALGRADWLLGVDDHSDYPPEVVDSLPKLGPDLDLDVERVAALEPDLVITSLTVPGHERCLERLEAAGLPCLVTQPHRLADVVDDILRIGQALDAEAEARQIADRFEAAMARPRPDAPVPILVEWWPKPVIVPGRNSWVNEMLALAGGVNPFADRNAESLEISPEEAALAAPEAVVMSWCGVEEAKYRPHVVARRDGWQQVPAIRNGRIVPISEAWLGRPGPRLLDGIERLREVVAICRAPA